MTVRTDYVVDVCPTWTSLKLCRKSVFPDHHNYTHGRFSGASGQGQEVTVAPLWKVDVVIGRRLPQ